MTYEVPLDIIEQIIQHLKNTSSYDTIHAIGRVSSSCLYLARKAIFTTHTVQLYADHGKDSLAYLQSFPEIVPHIQQLEVDLDIPEPSCIGEVATFLRQIKRINRLRIITRDPNPGRYSYSYSSEFPPYKDLATPILQIPALKDLELVVDLGFGFRFTFQHMLYIHLPGCPSADIELPSHPLKESFITKLHDASVADAVEEPGEILPLKSLAIDLLGIESYRPFVETLYGLFPRLNRLRLESIALKIAAARDEWTKSCYPKVLGILLSSQRSTLHTIDYKVWVPQQLKDPFLGLCTALSDMEPNNVLKTLRIEVFVFAVVCGCPSLLEWKLLTNVLTKPGWKSLEKVTVQVSLPHQSRAERLGFHTLYRVLPETDFLPLSQQHFEFEFNLRFARDYQRY